MTKKYFLSFLLLLSGLVAYSQTSNNFNEEIQEQTNFYAQELSLAEDQIQRMEDIQTLRFNNLQEIAALETTQSDLYYTKRVNIIDLMEASIRHMLKPEQIPAFDKILSDRDAKAIKITKRLKAEGADKYAIEKAIIKELY